MALKLGQRLTLVEHTFNTGFRHKRSVFFNQSSGPLFPTGMNSISMIASELVCRLNLFILLSRISISNRHPAFEPGVSVEYIAKLHFPCTNKNILFCAVVSNMLVS